MKSWIEWKIWRESVFRRDGYSCQECGRVGCYLEPHHIITLNEDLTKAFEINNGITLCRPCHIKTIGKGQLFAEKYSAIIAQM